MDKSITNSTHNLAYSTIIKYTLKTFNQLTTYRIKTLVYLGQFDTNYIIFRIFEIFKKLFLPNQKNIVKDISEYFRNRK
jgi:hypothetical protein